MDTTVTDTPREYAERQKRNQCLAICCIVVCVVLVLGLFVGLLIFVTANANNTPLQICAGVIDFPAANQTVISTCEQNALAPGFDCELTPGTNTGICTVPIFQNISDQNTAPGSVIFFACTVAAAVCNSGACTCPGVTGCIRQFDSNEEKFGFQCSAANGSAPPTPSPTPVGQLACGAFSPNGLTAQNIVNDCNASNTITGTCNAVGTQCNGLIFAAGSLFNSAPGVAVGCVAPCTANAACTCTGTGASCKRVLSLTEANEPQFSDVLCLPQPSQRSTKGFLHHGKH